MMKYLQVCSVSLNHVNPLHSGVLGKFFFDKISAWWNTRRRIRRYDFRFNLGEKKTTTVAVELEAVLCADCQWGVNQLYLVRFHQKHFDMTWRLISLREPNERGKRFPKTLPLTRAFGIFAPCYNIQ